MNRLEFAFDYALKHSTAWLPAPGEIRKWAEDWNPFADRDAQLTAAFLGLPAKPDDWAYDPELRKETLRRAEALAVKDRGFLFLPEDHQWPKFGRTGGLQDTCRCEIHGASTGLWYACYVRITEAKAGKPVTVPIAAFVELRDAGCSPMEDL